MNLNVASEDIFSLLCEIGLKFLLKLGLNLRTILKNLMKLDRAFQENEPVRNDSENRPMPRAVASLGVSLLLLAFYIASSIAEEVKELPNCEKVAGIDYGGDFVRYFNFSALQAEGKLSFTSNKYGKVEWQIFGNIKCEDELIGVCWDSFVEFHMTSVGKPWHSDLKALVEPESADFPLGGVTFTLNSAVSLSARIQIRCDPRYKISNGFGFSPPQEGIVTIYMAHSLVCESSVLTPKAELALQDIEESLKASNNEKNEKNDDSYLYKQDDETKAPPTDDYISERIYQALDARKIVAVDVEDANNVKKFDLSKLQRSSLSPWLVAPKGSILLYDLAIFNNFWCGDFIAGACIFTDQDRQNLGVPWSPTTRAKWYRKPTEIFPHGGISISLDPITQRGFSYGATINIQCDPSKTSYD